MINYTRKLLLSAAFVGLPFANVWSVDWVPVGQTVALGANGTVQQYAFTTGPTVYENTDIISDPAATANDYNHLPTGGDTTINVYGTLYWDSTGGTAATGNPSNAGTQVLDGGGNPIPCTLKVNGIVSIDSTTLGDLDIEIVEPVVIEPYLGFATTSGMGVVAARAGVSHLYFVTGKDGSGNRTTITVNVNADTDLVFQGITAADGEDTLVKQDMYITFVGNGQTVFNLANGTSVWFNGQVDTSADTVDFDATSGFLVPQNDAVFSNDAGGCKVYVTMDQTLDETNANENKVVFNLNANDANTSFLNSVVGVGPNSVFTYLSPDTTGEDIDPQTSFGGYAAVAFDPSNLQGDIGRLVLLIQGAYEIGQEVNQGAIINRRPFNDGAFIVAGHYVPDFDAATISGDGGEGLPQELYFLPAGIQAICRVVDDQLYAASGVDENNPYVPDAFYRRGLLIINDCHNHGKLASDPYWDAREFLDGNDDITNLPSFSATANAYSPWYAYSNPFGTPFLNTTGASSHPVIDTTTPFLTRRGCVIGVNGQLDIYPNCFADHAGCASNINDPLELLDQAGFYAGENGFAALTDVNLNPGEAAFFAASLLKNRNPSALIIDGLDVSQFTENLLGGDPSAFIAANPFQRPDTVNNLVLRKAEIVLRGDGALYLKSAASTALEYSPGLLAAEAADSDNIFTNGSTARQFVNGFVPSLATSDLTSALIIDDAATYDSSVNGLVLSVNGDAVQAGEGEHVLDVEGQVDVVGLASDSVFDPATGAARIIDPNSILNGVGLINAASIAIDYDGFEIDTTGNPLFRPLPADDGSLFLRYNSPTLFFNNFASFINCIFDHSDVTKLVNPVPDVSEPGVTGGERLYFIDQVFGFDQTNIDLDPDRARQPEVQFFNAEADFEESLNAAGVRFVVKDFPGQPTPDGDNFTLFVFFDHGDALDSSLTRYGRILLLSSANNLMSDGSSNFATESTFLNVFKKNAPQGDFASSSAVELQLVTGDQFPDSVPLDQYDIQRAHHLIMISLPEAANAECYARIGWERQQGDSVPFPGSFPYLNEPIATINDPLAPQPFDLDAFNVPPATIEIAGSIIGFGSFNRAGMGPVIPVPDAYTNGTLYVDCGGRLTITRPEGDDRTSVPFQSVFATTIAQRERNDYNFDGNDRVVWRSGDVDLPHDQATFDPRYSVQPYGFDFDTLAERQGDDPDAGDPTLGYFRISFENPQRDPRRDVSGAEEVTIAPFVNNSPLDAGLQLRSIARQLWNKTRATESVATPFTVPVGSDWDLVSVLPYIGVNDDITQLRVPGATMAKPFYLDVSGDGVTPFGARIREITSITTGNIPTDHVISEGAHGLLFGENNGRFGLGSRRWNEHSVKAWNLLGKDYVTIVPMGNMTVDLNDNLLVTDRQALIASTKFGRDGVERLTFHSTKPLEIRVPSYQELDLSSFGQSQFRQEIAFGGNVCVVFEEGATLRLPDNNSVNGGVVLYFNDNSQLIFEGPQNDFTNSPNYFDSSETQIDRTSILGNGQIWLNKNAKLTVNANAKVGVQTDDLTQQTDVTISVRGEGQFNIGDELVAGGAFEVGDPVDENIEGRFINFSLILGSDALGSGFNARFHIDREGFFGLGAGVVNKQGVPNGQADVSNNPELNADGSAATVNIGGTDYPIFNPDTNSGLAWTVQPLRNVNLVKIQVNEGIIEHHNAANGSQREASLIAIGATNNSESSGFILNLEGAESAIVRGGGNLMFVPSTFNNNDPREQGLYTVNVWNFAGLLPDGESYNILASGDLLRARTDADAFGNGGAQFATQSPLEFFNILSYPRFIEQDTKRVVFSSTPYADTAVFTNCFDPVDNNLADGSIFFINNTPIGDQINRIEDPINSAGSVAREEAALRGHISADAEGNSNPLRFVADN